ncbi:MAG: alkaline phosphatase family protein, partial [Candidatus Sumerlaeota bacterium]
MLVRIESFLRKARRWFSRSEWLVHLLRLGYSEENASEPGLILIQIDGLPRDQFEKAMKEGRLPFLKKLRKDAGHRLFSFYPGLPSTTPSIQGELHYGSRAAVPAFEYYDREAGRVFKMYGADDAKVVEERLKKAGEGLLEGGSSYANVYTGGADEAHFCSASIGVSENIRNATPFWYLWFLLLNPLSGVRAFVLLLVEIVISVWDLLTGAIGRGEFWNELKFVPTRVAIVIGLREMVALNVRIDAVRGLPIIHANFLGWDEQSHRRGPDSRFAHWSLRGIDNAIKGIWSAARRSAHRDYDIWVFSDHGQAITEPYPQRYGRTIQEAVRDILGSESESLREESSGVTFKRVALLGKKFMKKVPLLAVFAPHGEHHFPYVAANGPIGHVYLQHQRAEKVDHELARRFVEEGNVPMVLVVDGEGALAWTSKGKFHLPEQSAEALEMDEGKMKWMADDLVHLVHHPNSGDYVFLSTVPSSIDPMTFPVENGAHGGPSEVETTGFALVSKDVSQEVERLAPDTIRPSNMREMANVFLGRSKVPDKPAASVRESISETDTIRVMTYNVHSCIGMDGKISTRRIARVIAQSGADIIALQELDCHRFRTAGEDQALKIARYLNMEHHFHPILE